MKKAKNKIIITIIILNLLMIYPLYSLASIKNAEEKSEYNKYQNLDEDNSKGTSYWKNIPLVSKELLETEEVTTGGEGGQWSLCITTSKDGKYLFYGTDVGGLYRSTDNGKTWDKSMGNLTAAGVSDIVVDPNNSERIIAFGVNGTPQYTTGIYISEDGGEKWSFKQNFMVSAYRDVSENIAYDESSYSAELGYSTTAYISLIYDNDYPQTGLEIADEISDDYTDGKNKCNKAGLYKTEDGGNTWNMISNTLYDGIVKVNPKTGTVYIAKKDGLYISQDKGKNFNQISSEKIMGLDIIENSDKVKIYYTTDSGILYSEDDGNTFNEIKSNNFPQIQDQHPQNLKISPLNSDNMIMYVGEEMIKNNNYNLVGNIYYSTDGGKNWNKSQYNSSYNFFRNNVPMMERVPNFIWSVSDENKVWDFQNDWVSSSDNCGQEFRWDSNGINAVHIGGKWHFNIYNSDIIYLSSQDYNGAVTLDGGKTWKYVDLSAKNTSYNGWNSAFIYGGYAADEKTYFGGVSNGWSNTKYLTITHDGGKTHTAYFGDENYALAAGRENRLLAQRNYSSYQSIKDPKILFCANLRSDDGGYTWTKMVDEDGEVAVTGVYTHDPITGRLFGINDYIGWIMYSDDDGITWQKYNKESLNKYAAAPYIEELSYDWTNDRLYVAWSWTKLAVITDSGNKIEDLTDNIPKMLQFDGAPDKQLIGSNYCDTRIRTVSVDPNNPNIIYAGGSSYTYRGDSGTYRSCDGGKTWKVVNVNNTNSIVTTENGDYGGNESTCINVKPDTGELWASSNCGGLSKLTAPYIEQKDDNGDNGNTEDKDDNKGDNGSTEDKDDNKGDNGNTEDKDDNKGDNGNPEDKDDNKGDNGNPEDKDDNKGDNGNTEDKNENNNKKNDEESKNNTNNTDGKYDKGELPHTGSKQIIMFSIIGVDIIITIILFKKYKSLDY